MCTVINQYWPVCFCRHLSQVKWSRLSLWGELFGSDLDYKESGLENCNGKLILLGILSSGGLSLRQRGIFCVDGEVGGFTMIQRIRDCRVCVWMSRIFRVRFYRSEYFIFFFWSLESILGVFQVVFSVFCICFICRSMCRLSKWRPR